MFTYIGSFIVVFKRRYVPIGYAFTIVTTNQNQENAVLSKRRTKNPAKKGILILLSKF